MLEQLLKQKIKDPSTDLSGGSGQPVLNAISMLMSRSSSKTETTRLTNDVGKKSNSATISSSQKYLEEEKTSFHNSNPNKLPSQTTKCNSARDEALTWMDNYEVNSTVTELRAQNHSPNRNVIETVDEYWNIAVKFVKRDIVFCCTIF